VGAGSEIDDDLAAMERRQRRAARRAQREARALRVSRSVIAPEHWRMNFLRQCLKLWRARLPRLEARRRALAHPDALLRLQARTRGHQQRKRYVHVPVCVCGAPNISAAAHSTWRFHRPGSKTACGPIGLPKLCLCNLRSLRPTAKMRCQRASNSRLLSAFSHIGAAVLGGGNSTGRRRRGGRSCNVRLLASGRSFRC
jgi:hypothetical protein